MGYTFTVTTVTPVISVNTTDTTVSITQNLSTVTVSTNAVFLNQGPTGAPGTVGYVGSRGDLPNWTYLTTSTSVSSNNRYLIGSGVYDINVTLPASPADGDYINFMDGANWNTHPLTILRNGKTIQGQTTDVIVDVQGVEVTLTYNSTIGGWRIATSIGAKGYNGSTGFTGSIGSTGFIGSKGYTGSAGTNGTNGSNGSNGTNGYNGSVGAATPTVIGAVFGYTPSTGCNVNLGQGAGNITASGSGNIALGGLSLCALTSGNINIGIGVGTLANTTCASNNVAIGYNTLNSNTACRNVGVGANSLYLNTTGQCNVAIGASAGCTNVSGVNNIFLGDQALGVASTSSNTITLGNASHTVLRANVATVTALSDCRDKTNISGIPIGLEFINQVRPVKFTWNTRDGARVGDEELGFIAQELDALQTKFGVESSLNMILKENPERIEATPGKLLPIIVKAIQELSEQIDIINDIIATKGLNDNN